MSRSQTVRDDLIIDDAFILKKLNGHQSATEFVCTPVAVEIDSYILVDGKPKAFTSSYSKTEVVNIISFLLDWLNEVQTMGN